MWAALAALLAALGRPWGTLDRPLLAALGRLLGALGPLLAAILKSLGFKMAPKKNENRQTGVVLVLFSLASG